MTQELFNFLSEHYNIPAYLVGLIISVLCYRRYFDTELKYFPLLIAYTFFNELLGYFIRYTDGFSFFSEDKYLNANDIIYNVYSLIFFGFFYYLYWRLSKEYKHWILYCSLFALASFVVSSFFQNPFLQSLFYANCIGSWILLLFIILYLKELRPNLEWALQKHNLMFWVSLGLGVFYLFFPIIYLIGFLNYELWQTLHLRMVLRILIVVMYGLFIIGFIRGQRRFFN